ncbi:MAG: TIGR04282 family arsenosugar biosynthesis glycosyltransferase [Thermoplasmatales archaeon]|nr:MAG: TIGR04282 family arsenosugar biosynthesis glycosyltransferase [Thermoplasmatales archaeon]
MSKKENNGILLFVKCPEIGKVKSRMATSISIKKVAKIYSFFVEDTLDRLKETSYDIIICYYPDEAINKFKNWLGSDYSYMPQKGINLGERLKKGFEKGFQQDFTKLIALGSDSPDLYISIIDDAFENLDKFDTIIGPCEDGGYYLLGFSKQSFFPGVFDKIPWSSEKVFERSIKALSKANQKVFILPLWNDVDTIDDLFNLYKKNQNTDFKNSKTMNYISKYYKNIKKL